MICFEYLILAFGKLVEWTGIGKTDKIKIREEVLKAVENHRINLSKIADEKMKMLIQSEEVQEVIGKVYASQTRKQAIF